ncbi:type I secretion system permease/ATPase [Sulfitobacter sp. JBTF-M27]|uniref:Type I secretion system permease/ATPase n=1 Tax=Sulfitobacter sediminilitoris TaxID=2698830 RepID=A0A6P0C7J0_9RHOB|nr:type I secretion system permease/ATPase [Sulfitobacter sediminilitoris]NEK21787.1 type I secretion system permease/ATPase [Sulfitobacter sediminilitoris]
MRAEHARRGKQELRGIRRRNRRLYWFVALFSLFANLLMLTGPMYMLQVYDRVLASGSTETLVALSLLMVFLYIMMGALDFSRARIMTRVALCFAQDLHGRVFDAVMRKAAVLPDKGTDSGLRDLRNIQRLIGAPVLIALMDLPWTPILIGTIFVFHPYLGALALVGALILVMITMCNQLLSHRAQQAAGGFHHMAETEAVQYRAQAETIRAMGMCPAAFHRWKHSQDQAEASDLSAMNVTGAFSSLTKTLRLLLQSAMLGLGAWLVIAGKMTPGGMIAGSILLGRALSPVEAVLNQWPVAQQGLQSWSDLATLLGEVPPEERLLTLPTPAARMVVNSVTVVPPGDRKATLKSLSFRIEPGQAIGVIGPSGSGKSTLARALVGVWPAAGGDIRLDGAALDHFSAEVLGQHIGYLPQQVYLFDGTVAENIARLAPPPDESKVIEAAKMAGAHEMILMLPKAYDTRITADRPQFSGGQLQRIGLARALYGDPVVVVLDEPNAHLDNAGSAALNCAIRQIKARRRSVLIMAHRPAAIQECDMILMLDSGMRMAFGPKDEVLSGMVKNARSIQAVPAAAAGMR